MAARTSGPTPHRHPVDLTPFEGHTVLGESVAVLLSGFLRFRFGPAHDGMMDVRAVWPNHEIDALFRAMARVEPEDPTDERTQEQRDCDRFVAVFERVEDAMQDITVG